MTLDLSVSPIGCRIEKDVVENIDGSIRGDYVPADIFFRIGYHDIWEAAEHEEGFLFARAFLSISFWGYSSPNNWKAFRQQVFRLKGVRDVKCELESLIGPLEECIYWFV
jgi:hypothetical protein